jgi:serine/threonine protein kinase
MSIQYYLSPSSPPYFHQTTRLVPDLTGRIFKTELYYFAYGGRGDIWKAELVQKESESPSKQVAVKVIKGLEDPAITKRFLREMCVWSTLSHPNITPLLGVVFDFDRPQTPCLVSPYYRQGDIRKYLKNQPRANNLALISQAASAMEYLHGKFIVHGDIKPSNILVNDGGEVSITDFGLSRVLDTTGFTTVVSGTLRYMAPELLEVCEGEEFNPVTTEGWRWKTPEFMEEPMPGEATDVWALGMTVIEILTGAIPFSHIRRDASVINYVVSGGRPKQERYPQIDIEIWKMLEACWHVDPIQRPAMAFLSTFFSLQAAARSRL